MKSRCDCGEQVDGEDKRWTVTDHTVNDQHLELWFIYIDSCITEYNSSYIGLLSQFKCYCCKYYVDWIWLKWPIATTGLRNWPQFTSTFWCLCELEYCIVFVAYSPSWWIVFKLFVTQDYIYQFIIFIIITLITSAIGYMRQVRFCT